VTVAFETLIEILMFFARSQSELWYSKTDSNRAWTGLDIHVHPNAVALLNIAVETRVGDDTSMLFWTYKWLMGCSLIDLAPSEPPQVRNPRMVADALHTHVWPSDITGGQSMVGLFEYFQLWDIIHEVLLNQETDTHIWHLDSSDQFSTKSAYQAFFNGSVTFKPWR
jgi:hypothetical protein